MNIFNIFLFLCSKTFPQRLVDPLAQEPSASEFYIFIRCEVTLHLLKL